MPRPLCRQVPGKRPAVLTADLTRMVTRAREITRSDRICVLSLGLLVF